MLLLSNKWLIKIQNRTEYITSITAHMYIDTDNINFYINTYEEKYEIAFYIIVYLLSYKFKTVL